jgi:hypothetical protein
MTSKDQKLLTKSGIRIQIQTLRRFGTITASTKATKNKVRAKGTGAKA